MTEEEELEYLQLKAKAAAAAGVPLPLQHTAPAGQAMPRQPSSLLDFPRGLMAGIGDLALGARQRFHEMRGSPEAEALRQFVEAQRAEREKRALLEGPPSLAYGAGEVAGKAAPFVAASFAPGGATLPGSAILGAVQGFLEPSTSWEETTKQTALGGGSALGTSALIRGVAPRPKIEPEVRTLAEAADREGIPLFGGQRAGLDYVKRAEAHGFWNPFTRAVANWKSKTQTNEFVRQLLERAGVPKEVIPKNPSLSPELLDTAYYIVGREFDKNFLQVRIPAEKFAEPFKKAEDLSKKFFHVNPEARKYVRDVAESVAKWKVPKPGNAFYKGEQVQDLLEQVKGAVKKAYELGDKPAGKALENLYDDLVNALPDPELYRKASQQFANLKVAEDLLRASKGIGSGTPDPVKLPRVVERGLRGGVIKNYSDLADLARAGEATRLPEALPERVTGIPRPSDVLNAATFYRFNNPIATAGMRNPRLRDLAEAMIRYLPYSTGAAETPVQWGGEVYERGRRLLGGK